MSTNEELAILAQQGDEDALEALWKGVKRFIHKQARRYIRGGVELDDLMQSAYVAFDYAVRNYDASRGASFLKLLSLVLPTWLAKGARHGAKASDPIHTASSLNAPVGEGDDSETEILDFIADERALFAYSEAERDELSEAVKIALDELSDEEQKVIRLRYSACLTQPQTARVLNITVKDVSKLEASAIRKLRHPSISRKLKKYL